MTITVTKKEFNEAKEFLLNGGKYANDATGYFIFIRKDGERVFCLQNYYKCFKNLDSFVRETVRTVKTGG